MSRGLSLGDTSEPVNWAKVGEHHPMSRGLSLITSNSRFRPGHELENITR